MKGSRGGRLAPSVPAYHEHLSHRSEERLRTGAALIGHWDLVLLRGAFLGLAAAPFSPPGKLGRN